MKKSPLYLVLIMFMLQACFRPVEPDNNDVEVAATLQEVYSLSGIDSCVIGVWTMDAFALNNKFQNLDTHAALLIIGPSALTIEFRADNTMALFGQVITRFEIPDTANDYIEMGGTHSAQGTYQADGSTIIFAGVDHDVSFDFSRASIDGEIEELILDENAYTAPVFVYPSGASYTCNASTLIITMDGIVVEEWKR